MIHGERFTNDLYLPCSTEVVLSLVNDCFLKHIAGLFSGTLLEVLVVDFDIWNVSLVAWND